MAEVKARLEAWRSRQQQAAPSEVEKARAWIAAWRRKQQQQPEVAGTEAEGRGTVGGSAKQQLSQEQVSKLLSSDF